MTRFLSFLLFGLFFIGAGSVKAGFEGVIEFTKKTGSTEVKYKYYIKGSKTRIEDFGTDGTLQGVMLIDAAANKVIGISPERKLWMDMPNNRQRKDVKLDIQKTNNTKEIAGYKATEWKVTCKDDDRVISYWMADGAFDFFIPLLKTLNRADKLSIYFLKLSGAEGLFPIMGEEKKSDGTVITTLKTQSVKKQALEESLFEIPKGYSKYDK
ncbi:MAG: DUF4412 domain-containing protein [Flavobacteriales bacterium]|nr:DUF4412 domain-containing protein [Flavobacteriales bacterium]